MSYVSRSHFLTLHDALRKLLGPEAQLAAFVKARQEFQCDMLVNSERTDPLRMVRDGRLASSGGSDDEALQQRIRASRHGVDRELALSAQYAQRGAAIFAKELQGLLGPCTVTPHSRRLDVIFRDHVVIQLALGADKKDLPYPLTQGSDINKEPDWRRRNRLRISLGYDEDLFLAACTRSVNVAARVVEKFMYDGYRHSAILMSNARMRELFEASGGDLRAVLPPVTYWQVHGFSMDRAYGGRHYRGIASTVEHVFAEYYGVYPLDNPYCPGEDLNTLEVVRWLCEAHKAGSFLTAGLDDATIDKMAVELQLETPVVEEQQQ